MASNKKMFSRSVKRFVSVDCGRLHYCGGFEGFRHGYNSTLPVSSLLPILSIIAEPHRRSFFNNRDVNHDACNQCPGLGILSLVPDKTKTPILSYYFLAHHISVSRRIIPGTSYRVSMSLSNYHIIGQSTYSISPLYYT